MLIGSRIMLPLETKLSQVSNGRDTVTAEATPLMSKETVMASVTLFQLV